MIEIRADLVDLRCLRSGLAPGRLNVPEVLPTAGVGAICRGYERQRAPDARCRHRRQRVAQVRVPVPVAPVHRQGDRPSREFLLDGRDQVTALLIDGADAAEPVVMLGDTLQPLSRDAPPRRYVLQERHDVRRPLWPAERYEQERVVGSHALDATAAEYLAGQGYSAAY